MRVEPRTARLLGVLAVTLLLAIWNFTRGGPAVPATAVTPRAAGDARQRAAQAQTPIDVGIEKLSAERPAPAETGRNPFQFRARATPAPPPALAGGLGGGGPVAAPVPAGPPPPPPITLKYIGLVVRKSGQKVAVLSDGRSAPMYGEAGATIDGRYRVVSIGVESIELEYMDGRGRQTIRLTGQ